MSLGKYLGANIQFWTFSWLSMQGSAQKGLVTLLPPTHYNFYQFHYAMNLNWRSLGILKVLIQRYGQTASEKY